MPYDPAIPLLGVHTEETIWKDTRTPMSIAALFTIARTWKQPRFPLDDEWIRKLWYIHNGILLSYKKEYNESVVMRWMNLKPFIQSEVKKRNTNTVY